MHVHERASLTVRTIIVNNLVLLRYECVHVSTLIQVGSVGI